MELLAGMVVSACAAGMGAFLLTRPDGDARRFALVAFASAAYVLSLVLLFFTERFAFSHAVILTGAVALAAWFSFALAFRRQARPAEYLFLAPLLLLVLAELSGSFIAGLRHGAHGLEPINGPLAPALLAVTFCYGLATIVLLRRAQGRSQGRWLRQAAYVYRAAAVLLTSVFVFNVAAPLLGFAAANLATALGLLICLALVTYALTHEGLFGQNLLLYGSFVAAIEPLFVMSGIAGGFAVAALAGLPPRPGFFLVVALVGAGAGLAFARAVKPAGRAWLQRILLTGPTRRQEEARRAERRMVADIAHGLQTLLVVLRTEAEGSVAIDGALRARILRAIDDLSERVRRLIEFARAGMPLDAAAAPVQLDCLVAEIAEYVGVIATERGVRLDAAIEPVSVQGRGDDLAALITNLLSNALEHAPRGRGIHAVFISCGSSRNQAVLIIADTGPGMSAEQRARACDPLYRAPGARSGGGMGLGLAIARQVAAAHGGSLEISERRGGGTAVTVRLPQLVH